MNKSKNKPAVMEYVVVGTLVVAAAAVGVWYFGQEVLTKVFLGFYVHNE